MKKQQVQIKNYYHTHLFTEYWRVCVVLTTQSNITESDSVIVLTKIWTLRLQSAS